MVMRTLLLSFLLLLQPGLLLAQQTLVADVDRKIVEQNDIIQLSVAANFQTTSRGPDFASLRDDFEVLGTQSSNQLRIINGQYSATTIWDVQLVAKRLGKLTIPSFKVENAQSQPIEIEVTPTSQKQAEFRVSFLEAQVDQTQPYVQGQVIYTLRYYHLGSLVRGNIDSPQFNQIVSERLQNQRTFERRLDGRVYRVYEWVYALYPQTSGELVIPPQTFDGTLLYERQLRLDNQTSEAITLNVKPIPAAFPANATWLPASRLVLSDEWTQEPNLAVGDTLGRRISIEASGLRASQLPNPDWPEGEGYRLYSDPISQNDHLNNGGISSIKVQDYMAVVQQAGLLEFAALEIPWWNTQTDQLEIARLEPRQYQVAFAAENNHQSVMNENAVTTESTKPTSMPTDSRFWPFIAGLFALLWIVTLGYHLRYRQRFNVTQKRYQQVEAPQDPAAIATIAQLCQLPDQQLEAALKNWLKQQYGVSDWQTLENQHPKLYQMVMQLEKQLYHPQAAVEPLDRDALQHQLNALTTHKEQQEKNPLNQLYP